MPPEARWAAYRTLNRYYYNLVEKDVEAVARKNGFDFREGGPSQYYRFILNSRRCMECQKRRSYADLAHVGAYTNTMMCTWCRKGSHAALTWCHMCQVYVEDASRCDECNATMCMEHWCSCIHSDDDDD